MFSLFNRILVVCVCFFCIATSYAQDTKVVVIPLGGADFTANGQSCPQGQLVTGFSATGDLVCTEIGVISPPRFLGPTQHLYSGEVTFDGENGTAGARAACRADFASEPTARMCTTADIDRILQRNDTPADIITEIGNGNGNVSYWTLFHSTRSTSSINFFASNTSINNCYNLSSEGGDLSEIGTTLRIEFDRAIRPGGVVADRVNYNLGASCSQQLRLLCCGGN